MKRITLIIIIEMIFLGSFQFVYSNNQKIWVNQNMAMHMAIENLIPSNTATHTAINSGSWFDPSVWNTGTVPGNAAIVLIPNGISISYTGNSNAHIFALKVAGELIMTQPSISSITSLTIDTMVGTMSSKIKIHASAPTDGKINIIFKPFDIEQHKNLNTKIYEQEWNTNAINYYSDGADHFKVTYKITTDANNVDRFDTAALGNAGTTLTEYSNSPISDGPGVYGRIGWDPTQLSIGIITMGEIEIFGQEKTNMVKLSSNATKGQKNISLINAPSNWQPGDVIVITSSGNQGVISNGFEHVTIGNISGSTITAVTNLAYNHLGKPAEQLHCYVGNLSRNITFSSADISQISRRAHMMAMHNPTNVQIKYAAFKDMGRTDKSRLTDDFIFDKWIDHKVFTSKFSALGQEIMQLKQAPNNKITNPRGRYSIHLHRTGAANGTNAALVIGNSVRGNPGWAITQHDSHALVNHNVMYDVTGAALVSEAGNETGFWENNLIVNVKKGRDGAKDAMNPVDGQNYFDPSFYHSALFYDDYLFRGEGLAMKGRAVVCDHNVISDAFFGVGIVNLNPVVNNLMRVDPDALATLRPLHLADHFPLNRNGFGKDGDGVMPVEVALIINNTTVINSGSGLNSIERDMAVTHESRSIFNGFKAWGVNTGLQLTYQNDYSFKDVYISGKNMSAIGIDMWKHSSDHSFNNIKIEDCGYAIGVSKVVGAAATYDKVKTRNNGFTQWTFVNYSENNVTKHYKMVLDTEGSEYTEYDEHTDNLLYINSNDIKSDRELAFTTHDGAKLFVDVAANNYRFLIDGYISDSSGAYEFGVTSAWAQRDLRFDYEQRIYEFASKEKFEEYLTTHGVFKDKYDPTKLYFIINEVVADRLTNLYKSIPIRIDILNAPNTSPYSNAVIQTDLEIAPKTSLLSAFGTVTQSSIENQIYQELTIESRPSNLIDVNTNGRVHAQYYQKGLVPVGSSSYTTLQNEPWFELDLGDKSEIQHIDVFGTEQLNGTNMGTTNVNFKNFYVLVSNTPFPVNADLATARAHALVEFYRGTTGSRKFSVSNINTIGQYVRIQAEGNTQFSLAEIMVHGKKIVNENCLLEPTNGIITNASLECGITKDWELDLVGNIIKATINEENIETYHGNVAAKIEVTTPYTINNVLFKNKQYQINLHGKTVTISTYAKSPSTNAVFRFKIDMLKVKEEGETIDSYITLNSPIFTLTNTFQKYSYTFDVINNTQNIQLYLKMGGTVAQYYFDQFESSIVNTPVVCVDNEPYGIFINKGFECGIENDWNFVVTSNAQATISNTNTDMFEGSNAALINVTNKQYFANVSLISETKPINLNGKNLTISTYAKSNILNNNIKFKVTLLKTKLPGETIDTYINFDSPAYALTNEYAKYSYSINVGQDTDNVKVYFRMGNAVGEYYLDQLESVIQDNQITPTAQQQLITLSDLESLDDSVFRMIPVPTENLLYLKGENLVDFIEVFTVSGQVMGTYRNLYKNIDIANYISGIYIVKVQYKSGEVKYERLLIMK